ncbi:MAG: hypothetical protein ABI678_10240 [Kofleriaceae bacterium]
MSISVNGGDETPDQSIEEILNAAAALVVPFARMYLGPSLGAIDREQKASDGIILQYAFSKAVLEAGRLPTTSSPYEPHTQMFSIDERGYAPALDLPFVLGALRATSGWLAASPTRTLSTSSADTSNAPAPAGGPPMSARELRSAARVRSYAAVAPENTSMASAPVTASRAPVRTSGCGCRGGSSAYGARPAAASVFTRAVSSAASKRAAARNRTNDCGQPTCGCGCGTSTGCGCTGTSSCVDCIPRGASAGDLCACGGCKPPSQDCTPWTPSCETRNRLRDCLKVLVCDLLECIEVVICAAQLGGEAARLARLNFRRCLAALICKLMRCLREAICPPPCVPQLPVPNDCVPCDFAVEGL